MNDAEKRICRRSITIEDREDGGPVVSGYGAVFYDANDPGTEYELWPGLVERIMPGAFDNLLASKPDVRGLVNHNPDRLLGRTVNDTLRLAVNKTGLSYEIDPPQTSEGRDIVELLRRGDMSGSSFAFRVKRETWIEPNKGDDGPEVREINEVGSLYDVGPVTYPAYESTEAGVRMEARAARERYDRWKNERKVAQDLEEVRERRWKLAKAKGIILERLRI